MNFIILWIHWIFESPPLNNWIPFYYLTIITAHPHPPTILNGLPRRSKKRIAGNHCAVFIGSKWGAKGMKTHTHIVDRSNHQHINVRLPGRNNKNDIIIIVIFAIYKYWHRSWILIRGAQSAADDNDNSFGHVYHFFFCTVSVPSSSHHRHKLLLFLPLLCNNIFSRLMNARLNGEKQLRAKEKKMWGKPPLALFLLYWSAFLENRWLLEISTQFAYFARWQFRISISYYTVFVVFLLGPSYSKSSHNCLIKYCATTDDDEERFNDLLKSRRLLCFKTKLQYTFSYFLLANDGVVLEVPPASHPVIYHLLQNWNLNAEKTAKIVTVSNGSVFIFKSCGWFYTETFPNTPYA